MEQVISATPYLLKFLMFIRPEPNSIYNIHNPLGIKHLTTRLRINISQFKEHKFRHNFQNSVNLMCNCGNGVKPAIHYFLLCANFNLQSQTLFENVRNVHETILTENDDRIVNTLLFGKQNCENSVNKVILNLTIEYIISTGCFNCPLS